MIRRSRVGACVAAALLSMPGAAAAQQQAFMLDIVELADAAEGIYGDEGARLMPALDSIARALADTASPRPDPDVLHDALGARPFIPLAAYREGFARVSRGEFDAALVEFRAAAARDPMVADPGARSNAVQRAVAALKQGRLADAQVLLEQSDTLRGSSEAQRILGLVYWAASDFNRGVEQLEAAIRTNPMDERSRLALARVLSSADRDIDAIRVLQEAVRAVSSVRAHWWLAMIYEGVNRFDAARQEYEKAAAGAVAGRSHLYGAVARLASGATDVAGAVNALERAVQERPNDPAWRTLLANALLHQDRADDAMVQFAAAVRLDPTNADAHRGIGQIHLNAGRSAEAAAALRRAITLQPNDIDAQYALATALTRLGNSDEAATYFERVERVQRQQLAEQRRTRSLDVLKEEAALRSAERDHVRAVTLWRQVIEIEPTGAAHHLSLGQALANAGQLDAALAAYERGAALGAEPVVFRLLADLYSRAGRAADAARARVMYEAALQRGGNNGR